MTFSQQLVWLLDRWSIVHLIATPLVALALGLGLFTIAARRLPTAWTDAFSIVGLCACAWIATPSSMRLVDDPVWIYGAAAALWVAAPYRCDWRVPLACEPVLFIGGWCAGSSARQIGVPAGITVLYAVIRMGHRPRWAWIGLGGLALGTALGFVEVPLLDLSAFLEGSGKLAVLTTALAEGAYLFALLLLLTLVALIRGKARPFPPEDSVETLRWLWMWCGLAGLAIFDPQVSHATLFPSALVLCIAAFPYMRWLASLVVH